MVPAASTAACLREKNSNLNKLCQAGDTSTRVAGTGAARRHRKSVRRVLALVGGRAQPHVLPTLPIMDFVCLAASLIDYSAPTVGPVAESSYEACELSLRRSQRAAMQFAGENPSRNYRSCASTIGPTRPRGQRRVDGGGRPKRSDKRY